MRKIRQIKLCHDLKLYLRSCEGPAQDQQVFVVLLCILENIKKYV